MRNIDVFEMFIDAANSSIIIHRFFLQECPLSINISTIDNTFWSAKIRSQLCRQTSFLEIIMLSKNRRPTKTFAFVSFFH